MVLVDSFMWNDAEPSAFKGENEETLDLFAAPSLALLPGRFLGVKRCQKQCFGGVPPTSRLETITGGGAPHGSGCTSEWQPCALHVSLGWIAWHAFNHKRGIIFPHQAYSQVTCNFPMERLLGGESPRFRLQ